MELTDKFILVQKQFWNPRMVSSQYTLPEILIFRISLSMATKHPCWADLFYTLLKITNAEKLGLIHTSLRSLPCCKMSLYVFVKNCTSGKWMPESNAGTRALPRALEKIHIPTIHPFLLIYLSSFMKFELSLIGLGSFQNRVVSLKGIWSNHSTYCIIF